MGFSSIGPRGNSLVDKRCAGCRSHLVFVQYATARTSSIFSGIRTLHRIQSVDMEHYGMDGGLCMHNRPRWPSQCIFIAADVAPIRPINVRHIYHTHAHHDVDNRISKTTRLFLIPEYSTTCTMFRFSFVHVEN